MSGPYGPLVLDHFRHPRNRGALAAPTVVAEGTNPVCGDRVRIELSIERGSVMDSRFEANACALCMAAASMLTEMVRGRPVSGVQLLGVSDVLAALGASVPGARVPCVTLPLSVMSAGLRQWEQTTD